MTKNIKISIIIPIYNGEKYIARCLDSILAQTYRNFEIILINDGSTDKSLEIINNYSRKDGRIKIINKKNEGVSAARNDGLKSATGQYIGFVDIDDYIRNDMYEKMLYTLIDNNSQLCMISYIEEDSKGYQLEIKFDWKDYIKIFDNNNIKNIIIPSAVANLKGENMPIFGTVWRILVKADIAKKVLFNEKLPIGEDFIYLIDCLQKSDKIVILNDTLYYYVSNNQSATKKYKKDFMITNKIFHNELLKRLKNTNFFNNEKNQERYSKNKSIMYINSISNSVREKCNFHKKKCNIKKIVLAFNKDKYISNNIYKQLPPSKQIVFLFMKLRLYFLLTILFSIKNIVGVTNEN